MPQVLDGLPITDAEREAGQRVTPAAWGGDAPAQERATPRGGAAPADEEPSGDGSVAAGLGGVLLGLQAPGATSRLATGAQVRRAEPQGGCFAC